MLDPIGHNVPSPEKPRVPYIPNFPGDAGQILHLDTDAQPAWADLEGTTYPTGGAEDDVLVSDGAGDVAWDSNFVHQLGALFVAGAPPYTLNISEFDQFYRAKIQIVTPTVAVWALHILPGVDTYDYVQYATAPPLAAAATSVVAGGSDIAMPAIGIATPTLLTVEIDLTFQLTAWEYKVVAFARNAAGDIEETLVRGTGSYSAPATSIIIDGPMSAAQITALVIGT